MNVVIFQKKGLSRKPENPLFMVPPGRFERPAHGKAQVNGNARLPFVPLDQNIMDRLRFLSGQAIGKLFLYAPGAASIDVEINVVAVISEVEGHILMRPI